MGLFCLMWALDTACNVPLSFIPEAQMTPWNLSETHDFVLDRFGGKQVLLVRECTRSIVDRQNFGRFHYHEMLRLATSFEENYLSETSLMEMHASDETVEAFQRFIIKVGAHATACVQCVHAIPDILANAIYYACGLNLGTSMLTEHKVNVNSVVKILNSQPSLQTLADILSKTTQGLDWEYLSAVSNMSKHRSVIRSSLSEDWTGKRKNFREMQFAIFERDGKQYWSKLVEEAIGPEYDRLALVVSETGHELNRWLRETGR